MGEVALGRVVDDVRERQRAASYKIYTQKAQALDEPLLHEVWDKANVGSKQLRIAKNGFFYQVGGVLPGA